MSEGFVCVCVCVCGLYEKRWKSGRAQLAHKNNEAVKVQPKRVRVFVF